jgi:5-methylcytosine-specific restriction endonuclease McrA
MNRDALLKNLIYLLDKNYNCPQIATELACSETKVKYWLKRFNLQTNNQKRLTLRKTGFKKCSKCKRQLEINQFRLKLGKIPSSYCKKCEAEKSGELFVKNSVTNKLEWIKKFGGVCTLCKNKFPYFVYEFHHKNPEDKEFEWRNIKNASKEIQEKELNKCVLLCSNCHKIVHNGNTRLKPIINFN